MKETISETIQRELRLAGLFTDREPRLPVPHDLDAEAELCSAVLCEHAKTTDFDVRAVDFYSLLMKHIWVAVEAVTELELQPTDRAVLGALAEQSFVGTEIECELSNLRGQPWSHLPRLHELASRVSELARKRRLIEKLEDLCRELSNGMTSSQARDALARLAGF